MKITIEEYSLVGGEIDCVWANPGYSASTVTGRCGTKARTVTPMRAFRISGVEERGTL